MGEAIIQSAATPQALSEYGLYAIVIILFGAVVYLFKQMRDLEAKYREISIKYAEGSTRQTIVIEQNTEALKEIRDIMLRIGGK